MKSVAFVSRYSGSRAIEWTTHLFQRRETPDEVTLLEARDRVAHCNHVPDKCPARNPARTARGFGKLPESFAVELVHTDGDSPDEDFVRLQLLAENGRVDGVVDEIDGRLESALRGRDVVAGGTPEETKATRGLLL